MSTAASPSATCATDDTSDTCGVPDDGPSSSSSTRRVERTVIPEAPVTVPDTVTVSNVSSVLSTVGVSVRVVVPTEARAGIVTLAPLTGENPTTPAAPEPATASATVRAWANGAPPSTEAVTDTDTAPPPSTAATGAVLSAIARSSSSMVTVVLAVAPWA